MTTSTPTVWIRKSSANDWSCYVDEVWVAGPFKSSKAAEKAARAQFPNHATATELPFKAPSAEARQRTIACLARELMAKQQGGK